MEGYKIYANLARLNDLPTDAARAAFLDCCGSHEWARQMAAARPFRMIEDLYMAADAVWHGLDTDDWLEAFAAHPKIGSKKAASAQTEASATWSTAEQSQVATAGNETLSALEKANRLYEDKFGFIFIVCASGKSAAEMLALCTARLGNGRDREIRIAAEEQRKITELRLGKLLEK